MLFAIGSLCFFLGPLPGFVQLVGSAADGAVFFVGSVFFTAAALIQHLVSATADCAPSKIGHARFRALTFHLPCSSGTYLCAIADSHSSNCSS